MYTHQFARSVFLTTLRLSREIFAYSLESGWSSVVSDPDQRVNGRITSPWSLENLSVLRLLMLTLVTTTLTGNNWTKKNHPECNCALLFFHPWANTQCPGPWVSATVCCLNAIGSVSTKQDFPMWEETEGVFVQNIRSEDLNSNLRFRSCMTGNATSQKHKVHHSLLKGHNNHCVLVLKGRIPVGEDNLCFSLASVPLFLIFKRML